MNLSYNRDKIAGTTDIIHFFASADYCQNSLRVKDPGIIINYRLDHLLVTLPFF